MDLAKPKRRISSDARRGMKGFVFHTPDFDEKTMEKLADHPVYGPHVRQWLREGRTDYRRIKANLTAIKERAKRQKMWLKDFEEGGNEAVACQKAKVSYATFYKWKTEDANFKALYQGLREAHAFNLLQKARELGMEDENTVDRWNVIRAEIPEYNPKAKAPSLSIEFSGDIDFSPKAAIEESAKETFDLKAEDVEFEEGGRGDLAT